MFSLLEHQNPYINELIRLGVVIVVAIASYYVVRYILMRVIRYTVYQTRTRWDEIFFEKGVFHVLAYLAPLIVFHHAAAYYPDLELILRKILSVLFFIVFCAFINRVLGGIHAIYASYPVSQKKPIKGYLQILKLIIYLVGIIVLVSILLGRSPLGIIGGLGAMTAVILLIFRDTILSFIASIQLMTNDMVRVGDWIEMPQYNADGDVVEMALHTVKVRNFDRTITTIPTYKLIEDSFRNWRGMMETGGRRIMRDILIDQSSIRFCDEAMLQKFENIHLLQDYLKEKKKDLAEYNAAHNIDDSSLVNGRHLTNIGTYRAYVEAYLENHPKIHKGLLHMVRQMPPSPQGVALQIYAFTNDTNWVNYENIQADIFDHLLSVLPEFGLRRYQYPTGDDVRTVLPSLRKE